MNESEPRFYTTAEVARLLRVNPATIYRLQQAGQIPHIKVGNALRYPIRDIHAHFNLDTPHDEGAA